MVVTNDFFIQLLSISTFRYDLKFDFFNIYSNPSIHYIFIIFFINQKQFFSPYLDNIQ